MAKKKNLRKKKQALQIAPMTKRLVAWGIDWYIGSMVCLIPIALIHNMVTKIPEFSYDITQLPTNYAVLAVALSFVCAFLYFYVVPARVWPSQTLGKRICSLAIMKKDDEPITKKILFKRQILMFLLLEAPVVMTGNIELVSMGLLFGQATELNMKYCSAILFAGSTLLCMFSKEHMALHDRVVNTKVVCLNTERTVY